MPSPHWRQSSDDELTAGLRAGDREAAAEVSRRYWEPINRYCGRYLGDTQLGEDVAQETFAKLLEGNALPEGALKPWLYKLARNRCLDILRRHQRSPTHHNRGQTGFDAGLSSAGPRTKAHRADRQRLLHNIILQMPEEYRAVLMLKFFEGLSRSEMAEALSVTEIAVKGRLVRATQALYEEMRKITESAQ